MSFSQDAIVLVTGATGAVGPCVVRALCEAGYAIRTFSMERAEQSAFPPEVDERIGDVTDSTAVRSAMQGVDAVVHLAALLEHPGGQHPGGQSYK